MSFGGGSKSQARERWTDRERATERPWHPKPWPTRVAGCAEGTGFINPEALLNPFVNKAAGSARDNAGPTAPVMKARLRLA